MTNEQIFDHLNAHPQATVWLNPVEIDGFPFCITTDQLEDFIGMMDPTYILAANIDFEGDILISIKNTYWNTLYYKNYAYTSSTSHPTSYWTTRRQCQTMARTDAGTGTTEQPRVHQ